MQVTANTAARNISSTMPDFKVDEVKRSADYDDQGAKKKNTHLISSASIDVGSQFDPSVSQLPNRMGKGVVVINHRNACYERKLQKRMKGYYSMGLQ
jgi:hypothetical protein